MVLGEIISICAKLGKIAPRFFALATISTMAYPDDIFFDIETLVNVAQPQRILLLGDCNDDFLQNYIKQRAILKQSCSVTKLTPNQLKDFNALEQSFDVAIAINWFENFDKRTGAQTLARLRDVLSPQYCICLPITTSSQNEGWQLTDLFSFALSKVASYQSDELEYGLFKYNIDDYKKTPDWLNSDNWANPQMWGKYWW